MSPRTLVRLARMDLDEVATRGRQQASKWVDRLAGPSGTIGGAINWVRSPPPPGPGATNLLAGAQDAAVAELLRAVCPGALERVLETAESLHAGRFDLLGYSGLGFGDPIDWQLDPVSGRRAPRVHWSRIDPLDPEVVGDSKVVWELNRHQWLVTLAQAYRLTGDERHATACARHLRAWLAANPRGIGINWASSLEVALRLIAWCWVLALLRGSQAFGAAQEREILSAIAHHASHVERYLSRYYSPNTHLTGEALGLFYAGLVLQDHARARAWRSCGADTLVGELRRQVLADGVHFERATCYQAYTAEMALHFLILARAARLDVPDDVIARTTALLDALLTLRQPGGVLPQIGDEDGGSLLPLSRRDRGDLRGVFGAAAAFFRRNDYAWAAGPIPPEAVWLLGREGQAAFAACLPEPPRRNPSQLMEQGGYAVTASGWDPVAHQLVFDVGPLGCPVTAGHGHADLLSIQCVVFGRPCIVDPGTFVYTPLPEWRNHFRGSAAHGTLVLDARSQAAPAGPFRWSSRPAVRLRRWLSTGGLDYVDADHAAYSKRSRGILHRRRILFVKPRFWIVVDEVQGAGQHDVAIGFQLAPGPVSLGSDGWARAAVAGNAGLLVKCLSRPEITATLATGDTDPIRGWISPAYGVRQPAPHLGFGGRCRLPLRALTVLHPALDVDGPAPRFEATGCDDAGPLGVRLLDTGETFVFSEHEVLVSASED